MPRNIAKYFQLLTEFGVHVSSGSTKKGTQKTGDTNIAFHYLRSTPRADTGAMNLANFVLCSHMATSVILSLTSYEPNEVLDDI